MHETIAPFQVGMAVVSTLGMGGALFAVGDLLGRWRPSARGPGTDAGESLGPPPMLEGHPVPETINDNPAEHRFEIRVAGELVGFTEYERRNAATAFYHTEIDPRFRGRGLAGKLIGFALDASRRAGLSVQPYCPFVREFVERNPEYLDLIARTTSASEPDTMG